MTVHQMMMIIQKNNEVNYTKDKGLPERGVLYLFLFWEVLDLEYRMSEGILTIEPGAEIDHHQAEMIIRYAESLIRQRRVTFVMFDLADTVFMDSAGVGMMIGLYRELKVCGGAVGVIHMQESIRRIYEMAGLRKIIPCYEDEQQVMEEVKGGSRYEG